MLKLARAHLMGVALMVCLPGLVGLCFAQADADERNLIIPIADEAPQQGERITVETLHEGTSSKTQKLEAISQLPLRDMNAESQQIVNSVLENLSLYRRMPTIQMQADRRVYEYFTSHPDAAVSFWRAMGISQVQMWQTGPNQYETDTKQGTFGEVNVLLRNPNHYLLTCSGEFTGPTSRKPIKAFALLHLQPRYGKDGTMTHSLDLFVSFPSQTIETIAKLISPVSNRIADRNFAEISLFVEMISLAMARQPGWVEQMSFNMDGLLDGSTDELLKVTAEVYVEAQRKLQEQAGKQASLDNILPPVAVNGM